MGLGHPSDLCMGHPSDLGMGKPADLGMGHPSDPVNWSNFKIQFMSVDCTL